MNKPTSTLEHLWNLYEQGYGHLVREHGLEPCGYEFVGAPVGGKITALVRHQTADGQPSNIEAVVPGVVLPLPAHRAPDGAVTSFWQFQSWREVWRAVRQGGVYVTVMTFNRPLQPLKVSTRLKVEADFKPTQP